MKIATFTEYISDNVFCSKKIIGRMVLVILILVFNGAYSVIFKGALKF
jgi:hypothetical protein